MMTFNKPSHALFLVLGFMALIAGFLMLVAFVS